MAHLASSPPASRISRDGTIYPHWFKVDEDAFQPFHGTGVTQESPKVAGISPQGAIGSTLEDSTTVFTTRRASHNEARGSDSSSERLSRRQPRQRSSKVCAQCRQKKTKCILGERKSCRRCESFGVKCDLPPSRQTHEKELKEGSSKVGSGRYVFDDAVKTPTNLCPGLLKHSN